MKIIRDTSPENGELIRKKVIEHNLSKVPDDVMHPIEKISFIVKKEREQIVGGITGTIMWYCLHIDFLWVDESLRGQGLGSELLKKIEEVAVEKKCRLIQLDSFSFQAPKFYQKYGYQVVGIVEDYPDNGLQQYYLEKKLTK
ncbi:ribosomal protein S18 acetylase RimI-like enzyme [Salirhabdus euzebyi]|uniref:Ribosomal protein S18 acetylase RimI-like enzyme n=1 Tax=Salirhabdus euzebyi TaxID=394506 RepID=A0A841Q9J9_9BACI|nr:GNAT family N-acetyltransferase [Salirhabdus euzebyi]MBB6454917.1 ribosomal protein S18 acetylase RimI-like enzyme [Salirhabdus euzebyi]